MSKIETVLKSGYLNEGVEVNEFTKKLSKYLKVKKSNSTQIHAQVHLLLRIDLQG